MFLFLNILLSGQYRTPQGLMGYTSYFKKTLCFRLEALKLLDTATLATNLHVNMNTYLSVIRQ